MEPSQGGARKLNFVDSLRAIAILAVLITHVVQHVDGLPEIISKVGSLGAKGVQLFYIASAFTLFLSLASRKSEPISYYFIRRFFRIAPLFYIMIIIYLLVDGFGPRYWLGDLPRITVGNILGHMFFINGFNPYWINSIMGVEWSIAIEFVFYLLVPLLFLLIKNSRAALYFTLLALVLSYGFNTYFSHHQVISNNELWLNYLYLWLPNQLPIFALGFLFYYIWSGIAEGKHLASVSNIALVALILITAVVTQSKDFVIGVLLVVLSFVLYKFNFKLLVNKIVGYVGKVSYSLYLVHLLMIEASLQLYSPLSINPVIKLILLLITTFVLSLFISVFSHKYIENTGNELGRKLIGRLRARAIKNYDEKEIPFANEIR